MELYLNIFANMLGFVAIVLSTWAFIISKKEAIYSDLDTIYLEVLKVGLDSPKFRNIIFTSDYQNKSEDSNERIAYETYAFISLNWCETCLDRVESNKNLAQTWYPAVQNEYILHRTWIESPENHNKFKDSFRKFLKDNFSN